VNKLERTKIRDFTM